MNHGSEKKYLGVDWGEKRIGLAMGDSGSRTAVPFGVAGSVEEVARIVEEEDVDIIVVGEPRKMSNVKCQMSNVFTEFVASLKKRLDIPIELVDERLTSKAADALPGSRKTKAPRDAVAAMLILQTYLDREEF